MSESVVVQPGSRTRSPWTWVPSLYFAQGIPYVVVAMSVSVVMYKRLGVSNAEIAFYTSWLYLPWVIKPLWSPFVDLFRTKRWWTVTMQGLVGLTLAAVAFAIPLPNFFFQATLALFCIAAFSSATHDIAADGFYMLALPEHQQAAFVGVRSTFYRIAMITGEGLLVVLAGLIEKRTGRIPFAWSITFGGVALLFLCLVADHTWVLPRPAADTPKVHGGSDGISREFFRVFARFFTKDRIVLTMAFLLLYRFAEAQLVKMIGPFLLDPPSKGGLGLTTQQFGIAKGTIGVGGLLCGGILGGVVISRHGLKRWLWPMVLSINLPGWVYILLAYTRPTSLAVVSAAVGLEQFAYGFGFTAYMLYMIYVAEGEHKTAHYALCTGFMAMGMMLPGMLSGWMQQTLGGYQNFFIWVVISTIPCFVVSSLIRVPEDFGRRKSVPQAPLCTRCGYNLTGSVSGVCPECGTAVPAAPAATKA